MQVRHSRYSRIRFFQNCAELDELASGKYGAYYHVDMGEICVWTWLAS